MDVEVHTHNLSTQQTDSLDHGFLGCVATAYVKEKWREGGREGGREKEDI